jgi:hypothetical protein
MIILSHYQARELLTAYKQGLVEVSVSLDLNLSQAKVALNVSGVSLPDGQVLDWASVEEIRTSESGCFFVERGLPCPIQFFSEQTGRVYSLYPTSRAPTMLVSGLPMHRIKNTDPHADTLEKIHAVRPVVGQVLDTATGLGYTAIEASQTANHVTTIELDPAALQVCRLNPWSQALFDNPKITQRIGDSFEVVAELESASFTRIIHDPPVFALAGDLYSGEFYRELHRLLRNNGKVFHYIGDPESKSGRSMTAGVMRRLQQAGFRQVLRAPRAFGVVAVK